MLSKTIYEMMEDRQQREIFVVDVRQTPDFEKETFPGAKHIYWEEFLDRKEEVPKDKPVYLLCYSGKRSEDIAEELQPEGYEIYSVEGGYYSYIKYEMDAFLRDEEIAKKRCQEIENSIIKKFRKEIWSPFTKALNNYDLIQDGDKIAVCISGGKDSMLLAKLMQELHRHSKRQFDVVYLVMNPGYNEINYQTILNNAKLLNVPITVFESNIYDLVAGDEFEHKRKDGSVVKEALSAGNACYMCARMRRGALYNKAKELGCNKIALGHHYDDVIETILMGMLYSGQLQSMMPKLHSTNFEGMELIRPMYLIREENIKRWRDSNDLHFIQCACRFTESCASCGGKEKGSKRADVKAMIAEMKKTNPFVESNIFRSAENVHINTMVAYKTNDGVRHHFLDTYNDGYEK